MFLIAVGILLVLLYVYFAKKHAIWREQNVKHLNPLPVFGNMLPILMRKYSIYGLVNEFYNTFPKERYFGVFNIMSKPALVIRDPELVKRITVKDFDVFSEHTELIDAEADPLWGKNLFSSREHKWRQLRPLLSPAFTSSKMKYMFGLVKECAEEFSKYFLEQNKSMITINSKDAFTRYTNDVIATVAFGVRCNSLKNPNNEFYMMGADATNFRGLRPFKFFVGKTIGRFLGLQVFSKQVRTFFTNLIAETVNLREERGTIRPDMIHLLMEARKGKLVNDEKVTVDTGFATVQESDNYAKILEKKSDKQISLTEMTAQALIFFIAGFDTTSSLMSALAHELAINPDIQEKLRNEIDEANEECNGDITYEKLMNLKYLDMVMSETLRKWPPLPVSERSNVKPYTFPAERPEESPLHIPKNTTVWLPIYSFHRDPQYFPDPEIFDPERFSDENKHNINPFTYMPFSLGPRNCIGDLHCGSRFALMESKILFFYIMKNFEIHVVDKTPVKMKLTPDLNLVPVGGWWVGLKPRN